MLQKGIDIEVLRLLFDFQNTFHDGSGNTTIYDNEAGRLQVGEYRYFSEAYSEEAERFFTLFCSIPTLSAEDFNGYWDFVGQPEPVLD